MICFSCSWSFAHLKFSWYSLARLKDHTGTTMPTRVKMRWYHFKSNTLSGEIYLFSPYMDSVGSRGGAREVRSPLSFLHQTEARRAEKKIFGDWVLPLSKNMVDRPPPPLARSGGLDPPLIEVPHERITRCKNLAKNKNILSSGWLII